MIVFINGPAHSGKTTVVNTFERKVIGGHSYKMSRPLREAFASALQIRDITLPTLLEETKDFPLFEEYPGTPRQFQIDLSEKVLKPLFGDDVLGRIAARVVKASPMMHTIIDVGFAEEVRPFLAKFHQHELRGLTITRPGYEFEHDRQRIDFASFDIPNMTIDNKYDLELFDVQVRKVFKKWRLVR